MTDDQFAQIVTLLTEIRDVLCVGVIAANEPEDEGCPHPEEARVDMKTFAQPDHWICNLCKYEHTGLTRN